MSSEYKLGTNLKRLDQKYKKLNCLTPKEKPSISEIWKTKRMLSLFFSEALVDHIVDGMQQNYARIWKNSKN
ncbi:MAG: hypothetical protein EU539_02745 [Promethearchaeota archaeon]|nr:MAG: hypothetical protein EU539_02745 [Candidatus Lokiarchaeota archaeon]